LLRPRSVNFRQHFRNLSRKTVPLRPQAYLPHPQLNQQHVIELQTIANNRKIIRRNYDCSFDAQCSHTA
jgi:hypothetical protein